MLLFRATESDRENDLNCTGRNRNMFILRRIHADGMAACTRRILITTAKRIAGSRPAMMVADEASHDDANLEHAFHQA
jgi:hypothetical protein